MLVSSACPPPRSLASKMWITSRSPGFIMQRLARSASPSRALESCGLGGPVGTPFVWMNAKFVGSSQLVLQFANPSVHSRSLMCSDAHQCVLSHEIESANGANPGG